MSALSGENAEYQVLAGGTAAARAGVGFMLSPASGVGLVPELAAPNRDLIALARPSQLWLMHANGSAAHPLAGTGGGRYQVNQPQWSADGQWILFSRATVVRRRGPSELFLVQVDPGTGRAIRLVGPVARNVATFGWYRP